MAGVGDVDVVVSGGVAHDAGGLEVIEGDVVDVGVIAVSVIVENVVVVVWSG